MWRRWLPGAAVLGFSCIGAGCAHDVFTAPERDVLDHADRVELLSIQPDPEPAGSPSGDENFHGHRIMGRAPVTDAAERADLFNALSQGISGSDGTSAMCFNPRHGLRIHRGGRVLDISICFQCLQVQIHDGSRMRTALTTASPEPRFDAALSRHGLKKY